MPELPEVETSVQAIQEFTNQTIESIEIKNNHTIQMETADLESVLIVKICTRLFRRAYIVDCTTF